MGWAWKSRTRDNYGIKRVLTIINSKCVYLSIRKGNEERNWNIICERIELVILLQELQEHLAITTSSLGPGNRNVNREFISNYSYLEPPLQLRLKTIPLDDVAQLFITGYMEF